MVDQSVLELVRRIPLFSNLEETDLRALASAFHRETYPPQTMVFRQGEVSTVLYVMQEGAGVMLQVGDDGIERRVGRVGPGDVVGATALFTDEDRAYTLLITRDSVLYSLSRNSFQTITSTHSNIIPRLNFEGRPDLRHRVEAQRFSWLNPGESTILSGRRHIWAYYRKLIGVLVATVILLLAQAALWLIPSVDLVCFRAPLLLLTVLGAVGLSVFFYFDWRNDYFVVTNQRVVHEERVLVFLGEMTVRQAPLRNVQNVNIDQRGVTARTFGFGDVIIDTAGPEGTVVFDMVANPGLYRDTIVDLHNRAETRTAAERRAEIRQEIERRLGGVPLQRQGPAQAEEGELTDLDDALAGAFGAPAAPAGAAPRARDPGWLRRWLSGVIEYLKPEVRVERGGTVTYRKHWIVLFQAVWQPTAVLTLLTVLLITRLLGAWPVILQPLLSILTPVGALLVYCLALPAVLFWLWWGYENWRNDLFQVTPTSVIDKKMQPLFFGEKRSLEAPLARIQNVTAETPNFISRLLRMGRVVLQTAGAEGTLVWEYIYNPFVVADEVLRRVRAFTMAQEEERELEQAELLSEWFAIYHQTTHPEDYTGSDAVTPYHIADAPQAEPPPPPTPEDPDYSLF